MVDSIDVNACGLATNAWDVGEGNVVGASLVFGCSEHADGNMRYGFQTDEVLLIIALGPLFIVKFLESLCSAIHLPILLRLDCDGLQT